MKYKIYKWQSGFASHAEVISGHDTHPTPYEFRALVKKHFGDSFSIRICERNGFKAWGYVDIDTGKQRGFQVEIIEVLESVPASMGSRWDYSTTPYQPQELGL